MAKLKKETIDLLKNPATRQDSIDVLNSQLAQNAYYNKLKKYLENDLLTNKKETIYTEDINPKLLRSNKSIKQEIELSNKMLSNPDEYFNEKTYKNLGAKKEDLIKKAKQSIKYAKSEGPDKYHYLDLVTGAINYDAPFALYNSKIKPKGYIDRSFDDSKVPGQNVTTWIYDPLAVTPVDMLTPQQKKLREKIYGPQSYSEENNLNAIPSKQLKELNLDTERISPVELKNKKVNIAEPEHWLDITEPNGKDTKRMYFESKEEKESFLKDNPMLRIGQNTVAKIRPETLEYLKAKGNATK